MAATLKIVEPASVALSLHEQARAEAKRAVQDGLSDIDALVAKIDAVLLLGIEKPGIRQAFERVRRGLKVESNLITSLLERS